MAKLNLQFAARARRQLNEVLQYIALDNPNAAAQIAEHVEELMEHVRSFPEMGRIVFEGLPHREAVAYPCRIFYRKAGDMLIVVAVLRVEQLLRMEMLRNH